jgi:hypothetical protein
MGDGGRGALQVAERFLISTSRVATPSDLAPQLVAEAAVPEGALRQTPVGAVGDKYEAAAEDARMRARVQWRRTYQTLTFWC